MWLFVPAVKSGRAKKLASLWRGPYTVIDKTSLVNYRVQLIGTTKTLVVHRNRLKLCYGESDVQESRHQQTDSLNQALSNPDELGGPSLDIDSQPANDTMLDQEPIAEGGGAVRPEAEEDERGDDDRVTPERVQGEEEDQDSGGDSDESEMEAEEAESEEDDQNMVGDEVDDNFQEDEDSVSMEAQEIVQNQRPQRNRRPPDRYRDFVPS